MKKFRKKPRSGIRKKGKTYPLITQPHLRIVDNTNVNVKRIIVGQKNVSSSSSDVFWVDYLACKNDITILMLASQLYMSVTDGFGNIISSPVSNGNKYHIESNVFGDEIAIETTDDPTQFSFHNDQSYATQAKLYRDGSITASVTINPGDTFTFEYQNKFWFLATDILTGQISWSNVNTEINFLGIHSADAVLTVTNGVYSWALSNLIFS